MATEDPKQTTDTPPVIVEEVSSPTTRTYTADEHQAELDRVVAQRVAREEKKWGEKAKKDVADALERAKMDEGEKAKADLEATKVELEGLRTRAAAAERKAELTGKVSDLGAALKLIEPAHLNEDGTVNLEALTKAYPLLAVQQGAAPTIGNGGGGVPQSGGGKGEQIAALKSEIKTALENGDSQQYTAKIAQLHELEQRKG